MRKESLRILLILQAVLAAPPVTLAAPLSLYGNLPSLEDIALSPDGSEVAFIKTRGDIRELVVASLANGSALAALDVGHSKLRDVQWADNQHVLLLQTSTEAPMGLVGMRSEWATMLVLDLSTRKLRNVLDENIYGLNRVMNVIVAAPQVRQVGNHTIVFVTGLGNAGENDSGVIGGSLLPMLIRIDLSSGKARLHAAGTANTSGWLLDGEGNVIAEELYDAGAKRWTIRVHGAGQSEQVVDGHEAIDVPYVAGIAPDGSGVWVGMLEHGVSVWKTLSFQDGSWGVVPEKASALESLLIDRLSGRITGGSEFSQQVRYLFFEENHKQTWDTIINSFSKYRVYFSSASDDFRKLLVRTEGSPAGPVYMLVDMGTGHTQRLGAAYDGLDQAAAVRTIRYNTQDGLSVQAFLTLPPDRPAQKLPLIVMPHGGPAARDNGDFDWWAQALASRGYAVLQPNFRGSTSTEQLLEAGFGQWGRKMQTDLSDGVVMLASAGTIDPARVCIVGASYGGYAALAGVALQPAVYRCAVAVAGISDLKRFLLWEARGDSSALADRYLDRFLGVSGAEDPRLDEISPAKHLQAITAPILLVHGRDDTVVPFEQSQMLADALQKAGKPVTLVELKQEDHWLSHGDTRLQMLQATVDFLKANNTPD
jgi:fermentation-respiration switch protein FrsA (DUF1100 family)